MATYSKTTQASTREIKYSTVDKLLEECRAGNTVFVLPKEPRAGRMETKYLPIYA